MTDYTNILARIQSLPADWHGSGPLSDSVLRKVAEYCAEIGPIRCSVETGAGKSTLFFSQISERHLSFALDVGKSLTRVRESPLFRQESTELVVGSTQQTIPAYNFTEKLQVALIDGPHGYPFPELEYYYIYQHLDIGALLILDDTNIPTIKRMAEIICQDAMFDRLDVVGKTTFFRRTDAPLFDPLADGWWEQGYNQPFLNKSNRLNRMKKNIPSSLFNVIPDSLKLLVQKYL
ncbi:MAG: class I SAM-dependent methyltransferase [Candidatus Electrothrix sp. AR4]|nr:class I SAM-dependent methyltransferase [Candidatus Electrothrix sp. AR4]